MIKKRFISMLVLLAAVVTGAVAQETYKVSVKEGTEDATNWTITPAEATTTGVAAGTTVTATYSGTKKVKSVKAVKKEAVGNIVDLSTISGTSYTVTEDVILTGTPNGNLTIGCSADNWEVTLDNVNPDGTKDVRLKSNKHVTVKLKGTSRLTQIATTASGKNLTIDEAAAGGTVILKMNSTTETPLDAYGTITINGGTVKAKQESYYQILLTNVVINGGAVYLAKSSSGQIMPVSYNISGSVPIYSWNGSWSNFNKNCQYASTDNSSGNNPSTWTWW